MGWGGGVGRECDVMACDRAGWDRVGCYGVGSCGDRGRGGGEGGSLGKKR